MKATAFTLGRMAIDTKGSGRTASSMVRGQTSFKMVTFIQAIMLLENQMALASIGGVTALLMSENFRKA